MIFNCIVSDLVDDVLFHINKDKVNFIRPEKKNDVFFRENDDFVFCIVGHTYIADSDSLCMEVVMDYVEVHAKTKDIETIADSFIGGVWSFYCFSKSTNVLHVFSDLLSIKTVFYSFNQTSFKVGGSQFDVTQNANFSKTAIREYLDIGYLALHDSLFEDVKRLDVSEKVSFSVNDYRLLLDFMGYAEYPDIKDRYKDISSVSSFIDNTFDDIFERISKDSKVACGLSGGYDSRYIAVKLKDKNVKYITYDNPGTKEYDVARRVALALGNDTKKVDIDSSAVTGALEGFSVRLGTQDNLNSSHISSLFDAIHNEKPSLIVDGFIGGAVVGGSYYYKIKNGSDSFFRVMFCLDYYVSAKKDISFYVDYLFNDILGFSQDVLESLYSHFYGLVFKKVSILHEKSKTHADMLESLRYHYRGRLLIAGGPCYFSYGLTTLLPFVDKRLFLYCMRVDKRLRAGDCLYNNIFKKYYPIVSGIEKERTQAKATDPYIFYRIKSILTSVKRKFVSLSSASKAGGDIEDFQDVYIENDRVVSLLSKCFADGDFIKTYDIDLNVYDSSMRKLKLLSFYQLVQHAGVKNANSLPSS